MMQALAFDTDNALLDTVFDGVVIIDLKAQRITLANKAAANIMGYDSPDAMIGADPLKNVSDDCRQHVSGLLARIGAGNPIRDGVEVRVFDKRGREIWILARGVNLASNGSTRLLASFRDITAEKHAQLALREAEERQLQLLNTSNELILISQDWRVVFVNRRFHEATGLSAEALIGVSILDLTHPDDREAARRGYQKILDGEYAPSGRSYRGTGKGESAAWGVMRHIPFLWHGKPALMTIVAEEISRLAAQEWQQTFDSVTDMISVHDRDGHIMRANKAFADALGKKPGEINGRMCCELVHGTQTTWPACPHQRCMASGKPCAEEIWEPHLGKFLQICVSPLFDSQNEVVGSVHIARDITDRKTTGEALQSSEGYIKALLRNSAAVVFSLDLEANITDISPAIERLSGFRQDEMIGTSALEWVLPEDVPNLVASVQKTVSGKSDPFEFRVRYKNGSAHHMLTSGHPIYRDGQLAGLLGIMVDVTESKAAEEALKTSEASYRNLFDHSLMGLEVVDLETMKAVLASESLARMYGFESAEAMVGTEPLAFVLPEDLDAAITEMGKLVANPTTHAMYTLRTRALDGRIIWVTVMASIFEYVCRPSLLLSVLDVTSEKEAQLKVAESEEKNRLLIENAAEAIIVIQDGVLKFANPKATEISGFSNEELLSGSFLDVVHPNDRPTMAENYARRISAEPVSNNYRFRIITKLGSVKWLQINTVEFGWQGRPAALSLLTDVTAMKKAEDALRDSENRYRLITENSSDVIWTMDTDLRITYVSPSVEKLTGYTVAESMAIDIGNGMTAASPNRAAGYLAEGLSWMEASGGKAPAPEVLEMEMHCKDGSTVWTEVQMSFMQDNEGRVVGIMGVARNINERRRAKQALEESEQRFRALIEGARDAITVIDLNGRVTYSSPAAERMTIRCGENLLNSDGLGRIHPDNVPKIISAFQSLTGSTDGTAVDLEVRYRRESEAWGVIEATGTNHIHDPKIGGIVINYRDITERRQAEEAFHESESKYRILAENVSDVIWSMNMKTKQVFFSPSVARLLGYSVQEAQYLKMSEVISPTSYNKAMTAFSQVPPKPGDGSHHESSSTQIEIELIRKDGSYVWVDNSATMVFDDDGEPAEVFGVMRDVTQRKKAEEDLRSSEEYFRALIENAWDAVVILDARGTLLYESPSSVRILGWEPEEVLGKNVCDFAHPQSQAQLLAMFTEFRASPGSSTTVNASFKHKDGQYIECEGTLHNLLHDPKINGIVINYRDITDRRRAEEAIRTSEERFRNLVEATSDWVWEVDPDGIYTYVSPKVREVMGYEIREIIGKSIFELMPAKESTRFTSTFQEYAAKREPFSFVENSRIHKDGRVIVTETSGVPFFADDGSLLGYRGIGRDITNRKKVEKDLENSVKKVRKTMEAAIQAISHTMETRDPYTTGHQRRVTQLACATAKAMGIGQWQIDGIRVAGLLHDIGKIAVPTEILSKPGKLSDIEFSMIKAHPKVGFDILHNVEFEWPIARIVVQHHERLDGSGYPSGIRGKDILLEARILAVADVVEAMSSHRPYRPALGLDKALAEVARGEGTLYDPEVVRACGKVINEGAFKFEG